LTGAPENPRKSPTKEEIVEFHASEHLGRKNDFLCLIRECFKITKCIQFFNLKIKSFFVK
jgi:hypothetical protein